MINCSNPSTASLRICYVANSIANIALIDYQAITLLVPGGIQQLGVYVHKPSEGAEVLRQLNVNSIALGISGNTIDVTAATYMDTGTAVSFNKTTDYLLVQRNTSPIPYTTFTDGAKLSAVDLTRAVRQALMLAEEAFAYGQEVIGVSEAQLFDHGAFTKDDVSPVDTATDLSSVSSLTGRSGFWFDPTEGSMNVWAGNTWVRIPNSFYTPPPIISGETMGSLAGLIQNVHMHPSAGVVDTKLDTIVTAGKVSNSATTATASNVSSSIVARNNQGDTAVRRLSAEQVTANLTGNSAGTHTGPVTGELTGNSAGTHTGPVIGNSAGVHTGDVVATAITTGTLTSTGVISGGNKVTSATGFIGDISQCTGLDINNTTGILPEVRGGTGESTYVKGDILYSDTANSLARLPTGSDRYVLTTKLDGTSYPMLRWNLNEAHFLETIEDASSTLYYPAMTTGVGWARPYSIDTSTTGGDNRNLPLTYNTNLGLLSTGSIQTNYLKEPYTALTPLKVWHDAVNGSAGAMTGQVVTIDAKLGANFLLRVFSGISNNSSFSLSVLNMPLEGYINLYILNGSGSQNWNGGGSSTGNPGIIALEAGSSTIPANKVSSTTSVGSVNAPLIMNGELRTTSVPTDGMGSFYGPYLKLKIRSTGLAPSFHYDYTYASTTAPAAGVEPALYTSGTPYNLYGQYFISVES